MDCKAFTSYRSPPKHDVNNSDSVLQVLSDWLVNIVTDEKNCLLDAS